MSSKATLQKKLFTQKSVEASFSKLQEVLPTLRLKNLKTKKTMENSYLLVEYKEGLFQKGEIEINLFTWKAKTVLLITWSYPSNEDDGSLEAEDEFGDGAEAILSIVTSVFSQRKSSLNHQQLLEELRLKMDATEIVPSIDNCDSSQKQGNVVVKIRCRGCLDTYNETLAKCPRCGLEG
jgi:hypothetical protein